MASKASFDLAPYLIGNGRVYSLRYEWNGGGTQVLKTQFSNHWLALQTKGNEWEQLYFDDYFIYRAHDISTGMDESYELRDPGASFGSRWAKRFMSVGEVFHRFPRVIWHKKHDGSITRESIDHTWLRLENHFPAWRTPAGYTVEDVLQFSWYLDTKLSNVPEKYWYARGYGLVGWQGGIGRSYVERDLTDADVAQRLVYPWLDAAVPKEQPHKLPLPFLYNPCSWGGAVTDRFGAPRDYSRLAPHRYQLHEGIDFGVPAIIATPLVYAAAEGVVTAVQDSTGGFGKYICIQHKHGGETWVTWYAHLADMRVRVNQKVTLDTVIGVAGDTGNSQGRHLHFTVQRIGNGYKNYTVADVVDPEPLILPFNERPGYHEEEESEEVPPVVEPPKDDTGLLSPWLTKDEIQQLADAMRQVRDGADKAAGILSTAAQRG